MSKAQTIEFHAGIPLAIRKIFQKWGHLGGVASAGKLTAEQRSDRSRRAVAARWAARRAAQASQPMHGPAVTV